MGLEDARTYLRRSGAVVEQLHAELILLASSGAGADLGTSGRDAEAEATPPAMVEERARAENLKSAEITRYPLPYPNYPDPDPNYPTELPDPKFG